MFNHISIIGAGLIGGSIAKALKKYCHCCNLVAYIRYKSDLLSTVFNNIYTQIDSSIEESDMIIIATPLSTYDDIASQLSSLKLKKDIVIIDVGSVKSCTECNFYKFFPNNFLPCHPIAGREVSGFENSLEDLFNDKLVIITPFEHAELSRDKIDRVAELWTRIGSRIEIMLPNKHDMIYAIVSHFPQVLMFACKKIFEQYNIAIPDEEFFRLTKSDFNMWKDIIRLNNKNLRNVYSAFLENTDIVSDQAIFVENIQNTIGALMSIIGVDFQKYYGTGMRSILSFKPNMHQYATVTRDFLEIVESILEI